MSNGNQESTGESSLQIDLLAWYEVNKRNVFLGIGVIVVVLDDEHSVPYRGGGV